MKIKDLLQKTKEDIGEIDTTRKNTYDFFLSFYTLAYVAIYSILILTTLMVYYAGALVLLIHLLDNILNQGTPGNLLLIKIFVPAIIYFPFILMGYFFLFKPLDEWIYQLKEEREQGKDKKKDEQDTTTNYTITLIDGKEHTTAAEYYIKRKEQILFRERKGILKFPSTVISFPIEDIKHIQGNKEFTKDNKGQQ